MGKKSKAQKNFDYDDDAAFDSLETELLGEGKSSFKTLGNLDLDKKINLSVRVENDIVRSEKKSEKRANSKGKEARATSEQVLDPRTRLILFKLMGVGFLTHIDGCLSTGKEANVYYAKGENGKEYAVKIFKTSILVFKDRDKYVSGEYRFRHGYCRSNPRKMVKVWAEKEMRNLKRLQMAGLPSPVPHVLKSHVLIMDFLGQNGWCAPRLKDAQLNFQQLHENYRVCVVMMRILLQDCGLIHGDFSEYNLLYHEGKICVIDVSQSVELSHPLSLEFLRKDISNINDFFGRRGVYTLHKMDVFSFVTADPAQDYRDDREQFPGAPGQTDEELQVLRRERRWKKWRADLDALILSQFRREQGVDENNSAEQQREVEEAVFMRSFIPTRLDDIANPMQEMKRLQSGQRENVFSSAISTMLAQTTIGAVGPAHMVAREGDTAFAEYDDEEEEDDDNLAKLALYEEAEALAAIDENGDEEEDEEEDEELQRLMALLKPPAATTPVANDKVAPIAREPGTLVATVLANVRNALTHKVPLRMSSTELLRQWKRPAGATATDDDEDDDEDEANEAAETPKLVAVTASGEPEGSLAAAASDSDEDDDEEDDDDGDEDDEGSEYDERDGKYRRQLPSHDNPEERQKAKEARKEAAKAQKEARKLKRQTTKIPKHVKKRATTRNKK